MNTKIILKENGPVKAKVIVEPKVGATFYTTRNGYQWVGQEMSPELAKLAIEALQGYLEGDSIQDVYEGMKALIEDADAIEDELNDGYSIIWDGFWELSRKECVKDIGWCDPDTTYKEDILARFLSIARHMEENNGA